MRVSAPSVAGALSEALLLELQGRTKKGFLCLLDSSLSSYFLILKIFLGLAPTMPNAYFLEWQRRKAREAKLPQRLRGPDCEYVWCGDVPPWDPSLGEFRDFTPEEKAAGLVCRLAGQDQGLSRA